MKATFLPVIVVNSKIDVYSVYFLNVIENKKKTEIKNRKAVNYKTIILIV